MPELTKGCEGAPPNSRYALVKVKEWHNDGLETKVYSLPLKVLDTLMQYLNQGEVADAISKDLAQALLSCPAWADKDIHHLSKSEREAIIGIYITMNYSEAGLQWEFNVPMQ